MIRFLKYVVPLLMLGLLAGGAYAQTALTQTTLAAAITNGPANLAGGTATGVFSTQVNFTSATGITQAVNGQPVTYAYVGQELMGILTLAPGQTTIFNVLRAQQSTKASPHPSGEMVLIGNVTPQYGGFSGSGGFQQADPPLNGGCTGTATGQTPWVNILTTWQWLCSSITNTWVPGYHNPYVGGDDRVTAAVASAAGLVTPSGTLFHITGALAITGFNIPIGFNATAFGGGTFCVIPDGTFTTTTANNIALASTAVVNKLLCWTWDATNSKFVPSY